MRKWGEENVHNGDLVEKWVIEGESNKCSALIRKGGSDGTEKKR